MFKESYDRREYPSNKLEIKGVFFARFKSFPYSFGRFV
jgi:hypothetical protein